MTIDTFIVLFPCSIFVSVVAGFLAQICSCYYPTLLSRRIYYVVKKPRLQELLIAPQRNRDKESATAPEDRNKMAFVGCAAWTVNILWTISILSLLVYLLIVRLACSPEANVVAVKKWRPLLLLLFNNNYFYSLAFWLVFYQLDYSLGKHFHSKKSEHD